MTRCFAAFAIAMLIAGCEPTTETQVRGLCGEICGCQSSLPSVVDLCIDACVANNGAASDQEVRCLECLSGAACGGDLEDCDFTCFDDDPFTSRQETR